MLNKLILLIQPIILMLIWSCSGTNPGTTESIPNGLFWVDSIPKTNWRVIVKPAGDDIYFLAQSPASATTVGAQLSILRKGQIFLQDSLHQFYRQIQADTIRFPLFRDLPLDDEWFARITSVTPFTGGLATCHYKKGKLYENHSVRSQWLAYGLVQWPGNVSNKFLEERLKLAIIESENPEMRQVYQTALRRISMSGPIKLENIE